MNIIVAPDSFKGSLTATALCDCVSRAAHRVFPDCTVRSLPVADGGEGTVESICASLSGTMQTVTVQNPLGAPVAASYAIFNGGNSAALEMAAASGLPLIAPQARDVFASSTFGTGEMLLDALQRGCNNLYVGLGGSATNDGGMGCAAAFGVRFLDAAGKVLAPIPANFLKIETVDISGLNPLVAAANITIMSDVKNPLLGETGATNVFGKQKGADEAQRATLEVGLARYIQKVEAATGKQIATAEGAGAAGGLGAGLLAFTNAKLQSGVETVLDMLAFDALLKTADLVITGEGRMDYQSAFGKVAYGVGMRCKAANVPCIALVGGMGERADEMYQYGISSIMTTVNGIMPLSEAVADAATLCEGAAERALRMVKLGMALGS